VSHLVDVTLLAGSLRLLGLLYVLRYVPDPIPLQRCRPGMRASGNGPAHGVRGGVKMHAGRRRAGGAGGLLLPLALALLPHNSFGFHALPPAWSPPGLHLSTRSAGSVGRAALGTRAAVCSLHGDVRGGKDAFARRHDARPDMALAVRPWGRGESRGATGRGAWALKAGERPTGEAEQVQPLLLDST